MRESALISMYFMSGDSFQVDNASRFPCSYNVEMVKGYAREKPSTRLTSTRWEIGTRLVVVFELRFTSFMKPSCLTEKTPSPAFA